MVASDAPLATDVGAAVLRQGGNAMDAAVVTAFALAVVYPAAGNIGGGGFIVTQIAGSPPAALDFREEAPKAASRDMYIGPDGKPDGKSVTGDLAAGVPGSVAGLWEAHHKFGSKPWADLVAPAIRLADSGFVVDSDFARDTHYDSARLSKFPASAALFLPHGHPLQPGQRWRNPQLAVVLRRIAAKGPAGFYTGPTAEAIVAEMRHGHGIITMGDLAAYHPKWRDPIAFDYRGYHIVSMPPPSSGGMTIALMAHMLSGRDMQALGWHSPAEVHVMTEVMPTRLCGAQSLSGRSRRDPDTDRPFDVAGVCGLTRRVDPSRHRDAFIGGVVPDWYERGRPAHDAFLCRRWPGERRRTDHDDQFRLRVGVDRRR